MTTTDGTPVPDREIIISCVFDAPRERAFQAWIDPQALSRWFGPQGFTAPLDTIETDLRPGGEWTAVLVAPDGMKAPLAGTYREIAEPERLVFTTGDPGNTEGDAASVVTVTFTDLGDQCEMHFTQAGYNIDEEHATPRGSAGCSSSNAWATT